MNRKIKVIIHKSDKPEKKYKAVVDDKEIYFGQEGSEDYTIHGDDKKRSNYIKRHVKNEDWSDPKTAGFWARYILWEKLTVQKAVDALNQKYAGKMQVDYPDRKQQF